MRATPEKVLRRVRGVIGTRGNERSNQAVARLIMRGLLFDGEPAPAWRDQAACADTPPAVFYPDPGDHLTAAAAKQACAGCPVRAACLVDVLAWERPSTRHGIAGGLTPNERRRLVATRRPAGAGRGCGGMSTAPKPRLPRKLDRCEVCLRALETRPDARRRRCGEHLDQLHLSHRGRGAQTPPLARLAGGG